MSEFDVWPMPGPYETPRTQIQKLPARGSRKPNADEQVGDLGSEDAPEIEDADE